MLGKYWAEVIRNTCRRADGDEAVSMVASAADMLAIAETEFAEETVTVQQIIDRANQLGPSAGMPYEQVGAAMLDTISFL